MNIYQKEFKNGKSIFEINLSKIKNNYFLLKKLSNHSEVSAVIKSNAYGCGAEIISKLLYKNGCKFFFVAKLDEAIDLRKVLPKNIKIAVLDGFLNQDIQIWKNLSILPVCNNLNQFKLSQKLNLKSVIHYDTGMNRLGLDCKEVEYLKNNANQFEIKNIELIMSHFACSDNKNSPLNNIQIEKFKKIENVFPSVSMSIANSHGIFLGEKALFNMTRPGIALYGYLNYHQEALKPSARLLSPILQIRKANKGETVGYDASVKLERNSILGILGLGYADGIKRALGNVSNIFLGKYKIPIVGRISMDTLTVDLSSIPSGKLDKLSYIPLIDDHYNILDVANNCNTIPYEIMTSIGSRVKRVYIQ